MPMSAEIPYSQVYTSLEEIGLTKGTETLLSIAENLPNNSVIQYHVDGTYNVTEYPYTNGDFKAIKSRDAVMFTFSNDDLFRIWNRIAFYYSEEGSPAEWYVASSWEWGDRTPYLHLPLPNPNMFDNTSEYLSEISLKLDEAIKRIVEDSSELDNYYNKQQIDSLLGGKADDSSLTSHINNKSNPHAVTKAQLGLGNVDNTSDINKPISTATQTALNKKVTIASAPVVENFPIASPWEHLQAGWNSFYTKDALGNVTLSITCYLPSITMTANEMYLLFTMPVGYRPRASITASTFSSKSDNVRLYATTAYGEIDTLGRVHIKPLEGGKNTILLDVVYNVPIV